MICPSCKGPRLLVLKSNPDGKRHPQRYFRRRYCPACGARWRTVEILDLSSPNNGRQVGDPWRNRHAARNGRGAFVPARPLRPGPVAPDESPDLSPREIAAALVKLG